MSKMLFMALASTHQAEEQHEAARAMVGPHPRSQVKREPPLPRMALTSAWREGTLWRKVSIQQQKATGLEMASHITISLLELLYTYVPTLSPRASRLHYRKILQCPEHTFEPAAQTSPHPASHG